MRRNSLRSCALSAALLFGSWAHAEEAASNEPDRVSARRYFEQGQACLARGELDAAVEAFEAAFRVEPNAAVFLNLGRTYAAMGRPVDAVRALQQYLAAEGTELAPRQREAVAALLASQQRRIGSVIVTSAEPGVGVFIDGVSLGDTPLPGEIALASGTHAVVGTLKGYVPSVISVVVAPQRSSNVVLTMELLPPDLPPAVLPEAVSSPPNPASPGAKAEGARASQGKASASSESKILTHIGTAALGFSGVAAGFAAYFGIRARNSWSQRNQHCSFERCDDLAVEAWRDAKRLALYTDLTLALSLASAGVGVYLLVVPAHDAPSHPAVDVALTTTGGTWSLQLNGAL